MISKNILQEAGVQKIFYFIRLIILYLFCITNFLEAIDIKKIINEIPYEDQQKLERLFFHFVHNSDFGYVLFGDKPISIDAHFIVTPWENTIECRQCDGAFWSLWEVWEKYNNKLEIKNYLLFVDKRKNQKQPHTETVILINKKKFINTIYDNLILFEKILSKKINPEFFLMELEKGNISFEDAIQDNEVLLGILLGYGKHNSILYYHRGKILKDSCLDFFGDYQFSLLRIDAPSFVADFKHKETQTLMNKYSQQRAKLSSIYSNGKFFQKTLLKLNEG